MKPLARFFDRAWCFSVLAALGLAGGLLAGAAFAISSVTHDYAERAVMLGSLRSVCLAGNRNACELYVAEIKR